MHAHAKGYAMKNILTRRAPARADAEPEETDRRD
jgi:hypothetical protein